MRNPLRLLILLGCVTATVARAADAPLPEIAVSMRYFQQAGKSHAHLYLYRQDGKLLRQLTSDNLFEDRSPVFSADGASIVFTRASEKGAVTCWSIEPRGGNLHQLPNAPDWFTQTKSSPGFDVLDDEPGSGSLIAPDPGATPQPATAAPTYRAPDGSVELILKVSPQSEEDTYDGEGHGRFYVLHDLQTGTSTEMGKLPGFFGLFALMAGNKDAAQRFLLVPPLRVAFFALHLDSTDGDTVFALDLDAKRLVRLSPNWAAPFPLPGEPAFLTWTSNRYVPYGDGTHTENSSYIERWNAGLTCVRYAKEKAAGTCAGASMFRPGGTPTVVSIRPDE